MRKENIKNNEEINVPSLNIDKGKSSPSICASGRYFSSQLVSDLTTNT